MSVLKTLTKALTQVAWGSALVATLALMGCGGSERVADYVPTKLVVFGDELSLLQSDGSKYSINALKTDGTLDCATYPMWPQVVAAGYGLVFPECNPNKVSTTAAVMKATVGAKVADVVAAVQAYQASNTFTPETLVTLMAGQNDILAAYRAYDAGTLTRDQARAQVSNAGAVLGQLVNTIANLGSGARVLYSTPPDLAYSPFATAEVTRTGSADRQQLLHDLTLDFGKTYRLAVLNDGRYAAVLLGNELAMNMADATKLNTYLLRNTTDSACLSSVSAITACTTATLQSAALSDGSLYLWANAYYPGPNYQNRLGIAALNRARNNPF